MVDNSIILRISTVDYNCTFMICRFSSLDMIDWLVWLIENLKPQLLFGMQYASVWNFFHPLSLRWYIQHAIRYIYTGRIQNGRPHFTSARRFRPLPGRIRPSFLLDIRSSSCVDHPCKISANLVIVKALKLAFSLSMSVSDSFWPSVNQIDFEGLNDHQIGWNFAEMIYTRWWTYV